MTEQSTPSDLAAWVLDHGVGLTPTRQKQLAKGHRRLEAQSAIRGRAVVMYRERARDADEEIKAWRKQYVYDTDRLWDELYAADDRIEAVRDIHTGTVWPGVADKPICDACDQMWPCATIRALEG